MDEFDGPDIEATGRRVEDEEAEVAVEPAGHHDLLLVAAGQRAGPRRGEGVRSSNAATLRSASARIAASFRSPASVMGAVVAREDEVA
jgi:hypothetical protein